MNIKQVEHEVGISADNLRYYEKEGLLCPKRSDTNNYRYYSQEDIDLLKNIKYLRMLGVSVSKIRSIILETGELQTVLEEQLSEPVWSGRIRDILLADTTKEWMTPPKRNHRFGLLLTYTFFMESVICFLTGDYFTTQSLEGHFL